MERGLPAVGGKVLTGLVTAVWAARIRVLDGTDYHRFLFRLYYFAYRLIFKLIYRLTWLRTFPFLI